MAVGPMSSGRSSPFGGVSCGVGAMAGRERARMLRALEKALNEREDEVSSDWSRLGWRSSSVFGEFAERERGREGEVERERLFLIMMRSVFSVAFNRG
jgi:hypothetical protein